MVDRQTVHGLDLACPACKQPMHVCALACRHCELRIDGNFKGNEFTDLPPEHLQLLRVFVHCEGRIRDMEKVLGVSYPTVKNRIAAMRTHLGLSAEWVSAGVATTVASAVADDREANALAVLDALERGEIDHARAVADLRAATSD